jgi:uncharacterized protein YprB with RNaseH-like and TPR domain
MFGLKSIDQVGPTTAQTLKQSGLTTIHDVANTTIQQLAQLDGVGRKTAKKILYSSKANADNEIYRFSTSGLPDSSHDPIFIDIETDGLSPTMVWLIGVYDSRTDNYMPFLATDPSDKGKAVTGFMSWFSANVDNRPIVAYNGLDFDFPVLYDHINQYCPEYIDHWDRAWTFDPLWWGPQCNNAVYPGRTNKLEDVTGSMGWEHENNGLSGKIVGELFTTWMEKQTSETELEWEHHKEYCKDDVLSLKFLYQGIQNATSTSSATTMSTNQSSPIQDNAKSGSKSNDQVGSDTSTKQGKLDNF